MTDAPKKPEIANAAATVEALRAVLARTQAEELDCDRFDELVAPLVDGLIDDPALLALVRHHRELCQDCDEQVVALERALGEDDDDRP